MKRRMLPFFTFLFISSFTFAQTPYQTKSFTDTNLKSVVMDVSGADISVSSWDKNEVKVEFFLESKSKSFLEDFEDRYETYYSMENGVVYVELKRKSKWNFISWNTKRMYYTVKIPKSFTVDLSTSGGDVEVSDINGSVEAKTSGGDVKVYSVKGVIDVQTSGGDLVFDGVSGKLDGQTSGGDIKVSKTSGTLSFHTSGGDIDIKSADGKIVAETSGGDIDVNVPSELEEMDLETTGGDIHIRIPKSKLNLELTTFGGDINLSSSVEDDFNGKIKSSKVNGKLNGGGNYLTAKTTGGDISLTYQ